jgi:hypothetical protein
MGVCLKKNINVIGLFVQGILKLRGTRRGVNKRKCHLKKKK